MEQITSFKGQYAFLSNFYLKPVVFNAVEYRTAEHAFQAAKMVTPVAAERVRSAFNPAEAKRIARNLPMRPDWEENKADVMKNVLRAKFRIWSSDQVTKNPLAIRLLQTGDAELIEGNTWGDTFWGQCPLGNGENMLGKLLMLVRHEIKHVE